ncbi:MAG TPA: hypothetical protein DIW27_12785, partial [Cytophagales bacterium]|nr:hypothetical protein [Cytophagales bacterium]
YGAGVISIRKEAFGFAIQKVKRLLLEHVSGGVTCKEKLLLVLDFFSSYVLTPPISGGCPLLNTAVEVDDNDTGMRRLVTAELNGTVSFIESLLNKGIATSEFKSDIDAKALAYIFFCSIEGAIMFSRVERSSISMKAVTAHCTDILNQISK